jgi:hypothetical protein
LDVQTFAYLFFVDGGLLTGEVAVLICIHVYSKIKRSHCQDTTSVEVSAGMRGWVLARIFCLRGDHAKSSSCDSV